MGERNQPTYRHTGATMVEYVIVLILIALAANLLVRFFGGKVKEKYDCAGARIDDMSGTFLKAGCTANTPTPTPTPQPTPTLRPTPTPRPTPTRVVTPRPVPTPPRRIQDCGGWSGVGSHFQTCSLTVVGGSPGESMSWRKMPDDTCTFFNVANTNSSTTAYQGIVPIRPAGSTCRIHYQACDSRGSCVDYYSGVRWN